MPPDSSLLLQFLLIFVLISINAFFAASEIAIISSNDNKLKRLADDGNKRAKMLVKLLSRPSSFLAAIQVGVTISGLLASAVASESFADKVTSSMHGLPIPQPVIKVLAIAIITLLLSYFTLVFGELVPKRLAMHNSEGIALKVAGVLNFVSRAFRPFVAFLALSTNILVKPFGVEPNAVENNITEEEIRMMVDVGEENGTIEENEKVMINNVFEFNDRLAVEIMTHRTEISAVEITSTFEELLEIGINEGYSRIPVYDDDLDNIVGIVYIKDLLMFAGKQLTKKFDPREIMHPPLFVPETKKCRELLKVLKAQKQHMAVVIDEYGGTSGIVTMEDLLESIVGEIQDEYDNEEEVFSRIDESTYTIDGTTDLDDVEQLLSVELPSGEYDTLGGLIIDRLGDIPEEGEHPSVEIAGVTFTVETVNERRIERVRAYKNTDAEKVD